MNTTDHVFEETKIAGQSRCVADTLTPNSPEDDPKAWYQAALIAFRLGDYVAACTYLRRGIAANPYMAEGLTGRKRIGNTPAHSDYHQTSKSQ